MATTADLLRAREHLPECSICSRPDRAAIDAACSRGEPGRVIAARYQVSRTTLLRHAGHRDTKPENIIQSALPARDVTGVTPRNACGSATEPGSTSPPVEVLPPEAPPAEDLVVYVQELARAHEVARDPDASPRAGKGGRCAVCGSPLRAEIDAALCQGIAPLRISAQMGPLSPSDDAIRYHARTCIPSLLAGSNEALKRKILGTIVQQIEALTRRTTELLDALEDGGEIPHRLGCIRELRECLRLEAHIAGLITAGAEARGAAEREDVILEALLRFPEAGHAVLTALRSQERRG